MCFQICKISGIVLGMQKDKRSFNKREIKKQIYKSLIYFDYEFSSRQTSDETSSREILYNLFTTKKSSYTNVK